MFELVRAIGPEAGVLVEVPHAGLGWPDGLDDATVIDADGAARDSDFAVDALCQDVAAHGATRLCATLSRHVVDLNRSETDIDSGSVLGAQGHGLPRGTIWREATDGRQVLRRPLTRDEFEARLARFYRPYHLTLERELRAIRAARGRALMLAMHSMPSRGTDGLGRPTRRADIVPGTLGRSSADCAIIDAVDRHFRAAGMSVRHDDPYRGGATTRRWGRPAEGFHAVQIEVNRGLYVDEQTLCLKASAVQFLRDVLAALIDRLGAL